MKCLYDRAKGLVTKLSVISAEKKHLSSVLISNGYPCSFVQKISKARTAPKKEPVAEFKSTAVFPYVQGVSEPLRCCLEQQGIRTVFKSETTLRSHLVRPINALVIGFPEGGGRADVGTLLIVHFKVLVFPHRWGIFFWQSPQHLAKPNNQQDEKTHFRT